MANPQIIVEYIAETAKLADATRKVEGTGAGIKKWGKGIATTIGTAFAVGAVVAFGKKAVGAAQESEEATARLENIFRSMGDTTGQAAAAAEDYAAALSAQIGVEDETIMASQALLATFAEVSNASARQAGVFDRATAAAADLAAAGFGSMESNAVSLGKALNDPAKGLAKLTRQGVTFTDAEAKQIAALQESGKLREAQNVMLKAIEKQVQGTAEATATASEKQAVAFGEVEEAIGKGLLPVVEALAPVLITIANFVAKNTSLLMPFAAGLFAVVIAIKAITLATTLFNVALGATPIGAILIGVAALAIGLTLLVRHWDEVTAAFRRGWKAIQDVVTGAISWLRSHWRVIVAILAGPVGIAVLLIVKHWDKLRDAAEAVVGAVRSAFNSVVAFLRSMVSKIGGVVDRIAEAIKGPINAVIAAWNRLGLPSFDVKIPVPGPIPDVKFSFPGLDFPDIPKLAQGGIVRRPTLALLGEGGPEAVTPLGRGGAPAVVNVDTLVVREEADVRRIVAQLSAAVAVRL